MKVAAVHLSKIWSKKSSVLVFTKIIMNFFSPLFRLGCVIAKEIRTIFVVFLRLVHPYVKIGRKSIVRSFDNTSLGP
jgi:hypothetical protein